MEGNKFLTKKRLLILITLLICAFVGMSDLGFISLGYTIVSQFPDASMGLQNLLYSGSGLTFAIMTIVTIILVKMLGSKRTELVAVIVCAVGIVIMIVANNLLMIDISRLIMGVGAGIAFTLPNIIVSENWRDEGGRSKAVGICNVFNTLAGLILSVLTALVCTNRWKNICIVFLIVIIAGLIAASLFLPSKAEVDANLQEEEAIDATEGAKFPVVPVVIAVVAVLLMNFVFCGIQYLSSVIVVEKGFVSNTEASMATVMLQLAGIVTGLVFAAMYMKLKKTIAILAGVLGVIGAVMVGLGTGFGAVYGGFFLIGAMNGFCLNYFFLYVSIIIPQKMVPILMGILTFATCIGQFICSYMFNAIEQIMHVETISETWPVLAGMMIITVVLSIILLFTKEKVLVSES